eukprot:5392070-Lingulodinium_polyedra.AAC.1
MDSRLVQSTVDSCLVGASQTGNVAQSVLVYSGVQYSRGECNAQWSPVWSSLQWSPVSSPDRPPPLC